MKKDDQTWLEACATSSVLSKIEDQDWFIGTTYNLCINRKKWQLKPLFKNVPGMGCAREGAHGMVGREQRPRDDFSQKSRTQLYTKLKRTHVRFREAQFEINTLEANNGGVPANKSSLSLSLPFISFATNLHLTFMSSSVPLSFFCRVTILLFLDSRIYLLAAYGVLWS